MSQTYNFPMLGSASLSASRTVINDAADALLTLFSGAALPTSPTNPYMLAVKTADFTLHQRSADGTFHQVAKVPQNADAATQNWGFLRHDGSQVATGSIDLDGQDLILTADGLTRIENGTNGSIRLVINSVESIVLGIAAGEYAFNETGADINFRVESDADPNFFFLDAGLASGAGRLGIKTAAPVSTLDVVGSFSHNVVATSTSPYTLLESDSSLEVTAGAGTFAVNLPAIVRGRRYHVKIVATGGGVCTITRAGADTIEDEGTGAAGTVITLTSVNSSITIYGGTGTVWRIESMKGTVGVA